MKLGRFQSQLAGAVAAKSGIARQHAAAIIQHALELPSEDLKKKVKLTGIGEVAFVHKKLTPESDPRQPTRTEAPFATLVILKAGAGQKKLIFRDLQNAKLKDFSKYKLINIGEFVMGGLEGDPDLDVDETTPPNEGLVQGNPAVACPAIHHFIVDLGGDVDFGDDTTTAESKPKSRS